MATEKIESGAVAVAPLAGNTVAFNTTMAPHADGLGLLVRVMVVLIKVATPGMISNVGLKSGMLDW